MNIPVKKPFSVIIAVFYAFSLFLVACGGGGGSTPTGTTTPDDGMAEPPLVSRITIPSGLTAVDTAISVDDTEIAVAIVEDSTGSAEIVIYSISTGAEQRRFAVPTDLNTSIFKLDINNIFWGAGDRLTAVDGYGSWYVMNASTGNLLDNNFITNPFVDKCASSLSRHAFDANTNQLFSRTVDLTSERICRHNLLTGTREELTPVSAPGAVASMSFNADGSILWVNFYEPDNISNPFDTGIAATYGYDPSTMLLVSTRPGEERQELVVIGDDYRVSIVDVLFPTFLPLDRRLDMDFRGISGSRNGAVIAGDFDDGGTRIETRIIALPTATLIGTITDDDDGARAFTSDGSIGAFVRENIISLYDLSTSTSATALLPLPVPFPGTLNGTLTIDGTTETLTGLCQLITDTTVGPAVVDIEGSTPSGYNVDIHAQNLLGSITYRVTKSPEDFYVSRVEAIVLGIVDVPIPTLGVTGNQITGVAALYPTDEWLEIFSNDSVGSSQRMDVSLATECVL